MIERRKYLDALIRRQWNGRIKVITGIRRCGKSTLLFDLYREHLLADGVPEDHIILLALDDDLNENFLLISGNVHPIPARNTMFLSTKYSLPFPKTNLSSRMSRSGFTVF